MNVITHRSSRGGLLLAGLLLALVGAVGEAAAQEVVPGGGGGISVAGSGEVKGKPTVVESTATVSGDAELAADATVKYRDARRRAVEALGGLKLEGLKIEPGGFAVNQSVDSAQAQAVMQGNAAPGGKQRIAVTEQLKITIIGLDKLKEDELMDTVLKVLDTGRDAGLVIGRPSPRNYYEMQAYYNSGGGGTGNLVNFKLTDTEALREQSYKAAMEDARKKAERLAALAGVKLGRVVSIKEAVSVGGNNPQNAVMAAYGVLSPTETNEISTGVFKEVSVKVNLAVQFEIAK